MTHPSRKILPLVGLLLITALGCGTAGQPSPTPPAELLPTPVPPTPTTRLPSATPRPSVAPSPSSTPTPETAALSRVQFALDVDESGKLVFPGDEFVYGVTRVYVGFAYHDLGDVAEVTSTWHQNGNLVVSDTLSWDGGEEGYYIIWMEDPHGLGRGNWRWELTGAGDEAWLGGGTFRVSGEPRFSNPEWAISFDPPLGWRAESEGQGFVTFVSPNGEAALVLRVAPATAELTATVDANLALFREDHPRAEVLETQTTTVNGEPARLNRVRYTDQEGQDQTLYLVSSLRAGWAYSLWMLGPAEETATLDALLNASRRSVRFLEPR